MTHKAMKFRVQNPEHSKAIQERLFEMGYKWLSDGYNIKRVNAPVLYSEENGYITFGTNTDFTNDKYQETTLEEITEWTPKQGEMIEVRDLKSDTWINSEFVYFEKSLTFPYAVITRDRRCIVSYKYARPLNPIRTEIEAIKARLNELEAKL